MNLIERINNELQRWFVKRVEVKLLTVHDYEYRHRGQKEIGSVSYDVDKEAYTGRAKLYFKDHRGRTVKTKIVDTDELLNLNGDG